MTREDLYQERFKRLRIHHDDAVVDLLEHFTDPTLYRTSRGIRKISMNQSNEGALLRKSKGATRNYYFLEFLSLWDLLKCWHQQDLNTEYQQKKETGQRDYRESNASYALADLVHQLLEKLFGTRLIYNCQDIEEGRSLDFAKKIRFAEDELTRFCALLLDIIENTRTRKRVALRNTTGGKNIFVNFLRLLESQEQSLLCQRVITFEAIITAFDGLISARSANPYDVAEIELYQRMIKGIMSRCGS